ncbi:MAG TPA: penicillin-binding transpeptidase domain-containing protein, partial [Polyangiaceae bacterium]
ALSPDTGAVLAVFSIPGDRGDPLLTAHQPASTFKPFTALAALEAGTITKTTERECTGTYVFAGKDFTCAGKHGKENAAEAIVRSCNGFFYAVGAEMDHGRILDVARRFGFGSRTGIELLDEAGSVASPARDDEIKRDPTSAVPLLDAIGHGEMKITLLQLARAYAVFANGGTVPRLTLRASPSAPPAPRILELNPEYLDVVRGALLDTVATEAGTAHTVAIPGFEFAAKTGSSDAPARSGAPLSATKDKDDEDTWFVAYAPPRSPSILVAVRIERGDAGQDAKAVGKQVLEAWRDIPRDPVPGAVR